MGEVLKKMQVWQKSITKKLVTEDTAKPANSKICLGTVKYTGELLNLDVFIENLLTLFYWNFLLLGGVGFFWGLPFMDILLVSSNYRRISPTCQ